MIDLQKFSLQLRVETLRTNIHLYELVSLLALGDDGCHIIV